MRTRRKIYADNDSVVTPPTKRCKVSKEDAETEEEASDSSSSTNIGCLPPEVWALSLEFLLYEDVLQASLISKPFLNDVMPQLTRICIMKASELHIAPTRRFRNVTVINMFCMVKCVEGNCSLHTICPDVAGRVVPFLSRFPKLEESNLLGLCEHDPNDSGWFQYDPETCQTVDEGRTVMTSLISSLCGGFRSGLLPDIKAINGISCPRRGINIDGTGCDHCKHMVRSFPLESVIFWQHNGSEEGLCEPFADFYNGLCLTSNERLECIAERPGGEKLVKERAKEIFEHLLTCVSKGPAENSTGVECQVYFYNEAILSDIVALAEFLFKNQTSKRGLARLLNPEDCLDSIMEGVELHEDSREGDIPLRPLFSAVALDELKDIGIPFPMRAFKLLDYSEEIDKWVYRDDVNAAPGAADATILSAPSAENENNV